MMGLREILVVEDPNKTDNYIVIGGNMRLTALKKLDYKTAPVKIIKDATIEQLKAYIIKDNVSGGEWDEELLKQDWDID
jgi:ParB-like chromosome segregation protein Spo0J